MNYKYLILGLMAGVTAHTVSWFSYNAQFVWDCWKSRPLVSAFMFGTPATFFFWLASKYMYKATSSVWQIRWLLFAASFPSMYFLSSTLLGEQFATSKNLLTMFFAICIILVQFFYKG